jgi:outer membrane protein, heavy metal efflux system
MSDKLVENEAVTHRGLLLALLCLVAGPLAAAERVSLSDAVSEALSRNASLLAERAGIDIADARVVTARLRPNPAVSLTGDHLDLLGTHFNDVNGGGPSEMALGVAYSLLRGGKRPRRIEVAQETRAVTELQFRSAARALALQVEQSFVDALLARDSLQLARENQEFFRQIVEINETRARAGDIAEVELIRSRLAALQYQTAVRAAEQRRRESLVRLQALMGRARPAADFDVLGDLDRPDSSPLLEDLEKQAAENRLDLIALRRDIRRADAELALQRASAKQDWTVGAEYVRQQVNARANALSFTLSAPIPLFDRNQGEIARAAGERRQAELKVRALETAVAADVESAWSGFMTARSLLESIRGAMLDSAREVREITSFSYRRGDANLLSLLDAQRAFNDTMQAFVEARAEYARSLYELDNVTGKDSLP